MKTVMFTMFVTISNILADEICMTLTLTLEGTKVKCKYANQKSICDFLFDNNRNVCPICIVCEIIR